MLIPYIYRKLFFIKYRNHSEGLFRFFFCIYHRKGTSFEILRRSWSSFLYETRELVFPVRSSNWQYPSQMSQWTPLIKNLLRNISLILIDIFSLLIDMIRWSLNKRSPMRSFFFFFHCFLRVIDEGLHMIKQIVKNTSINFRGNNFFNTFFYLGPKFYFIPLQEVPYFQQTFLFVIEEKFIEN